MPDSLIISGTATDTLDLWAAASDPETPASALTYTIFATPDTLLLSYDSANGKLSVAAKNPVDPSRALLIISAGDPEGAETSDTVAVRLTGEIVGVAPGPHALIPQKFTVEQNYPNPFNPITHIRFGLPVAAEVRVEIYNLLGQRVAVPLNARKPAGWHTLEFRSGTLASGIYLYVFHAGNFREVRKMILLK